MKKIIGSLVVAALVLAAAAPSAYAGQRQRNIWEGIAIGAGAVLLGHALLNANRDYPPAHPVTVVERRSLYYAPPRYHHRGYWTTRRVWVPPVRERIWRSAHHDRYGTWIGGHWIMVKKRPGYWTRERVWVGCR